MAVAPISFLLEGRLESHRLQRCVLNPELSRVFFHHRSILEGGSILMIPDRKTK